MPLPDGGAGCADGTREGYVSLATYPFIAACAGAWSVPGITPPSVAPVCGRDAGNDSMNPDGAGCSAADLCAPGWHICQGFDEVAADAPSGCADAVPSPPGNNGSNYLLFAIAQHSQAGSVCDGTAGDDNDIFGCGAFGQVLESGNQCGPLNQTLASTVAGQCGWTQASPPNGPWRCLGSNSLNEGDFVTKDGCPGTSCSEGGFAYGSSDKGGVLCCRDLEQ